MPIVSKLRGSVRPETKMFFLKTFIALLLFFFFILYILIEEPLKQVNLIFLTQVIC